MFVVLFSYKQMISLPREWKQEDEIEGTGKNLQSFKQWFSTRQPQDDLK